MSRLIISTSYRPNSNSEKIAEFIANLSDRFQHVCLQPVNVEFRGQYITRPEQINSEAAAALQSIIRSTELILFVSTYYKSLPGLFKNFLDVVRIRDVYHKKVIGLVANSHKQQDFGARIALQSLMGIAEFHRSRTLFVPYIPPINPGKPDSESIHEYMEYFDLYANLNKLA